MKRGRFFATIGAVLSIPALSTKQRILQVEVVMAESASVYEHMLGLGLVDKSEVWRAAMPWRYYSDRLTLPVTKVSDG